MKGKITRFMLRVTDALVRAEHPKNSEDDVPAHLQRGRQGEEAAHFYLRDQGYTIVARNFRSPRHRGEIDLIGWDGNVLCFIEVKARGRRGVVPAEMAVDAPKRGLLRATARDYLHRVKASPVVRFDVISLYFHTENEAPDITLFKNAFPMS